MTYHDLRAAAEKARAADEAWERVSDESDDDADVERAMDARDETLAEMRRHIYPERVLALLDEAVDWREQALAAEAQWLTWQARAGAAELTVETLRRDYALLVRAHLHPSDDYRMRVFREAMARVEGWEANGS